MKNTKLRLTAIILAVTVALVALYAVLTGIAFKPTVTEGEFEFSITYELDGETVTVSDTVWARYVRNDGYADTKTRVYEGGITGLGEGGSHYVLREDENGRIELVTYLYPDYLMGDPEYDYFDDQPFAPRIYYYDKEEVFYEDDETLEAQGVKLISFEYPEPIENPLAFSHISYCSGAVVIPALLISLLGLLAIIIFVRKEKELKYKAVDVISILLNFAIGLTVVPFTTVLGVLIDITGGNDVFIHQATYFIPAFTVLCLSASVGLRRKGYRLAGLLAGLIGPAICVLTLVVLAAIS